MKQVLNITECPGSYCELKRSDLERKRFKSDTGKVTYRHICKDHGGRMIQRKTTCDDCGKDFYFGVSGKIPETCKPCRKKRHNKICRDKERKKKVARARNEKNEFGCLNYDAYCKGGECLRPLFPCNMKKYAA